MFANATVNVSLDLGNMCFMHIVPLILIPLILLLISLPFVGNEMWKSAAACWVGTGVCFLWLIIACSASKAVDNVEEMSVTNVFIASNDSTEKRIHQQAEPEGVNITSLTGTFFNEPVNLRKTNYKSVYCGVCFDTVRPSHEIVNQDNKVLWRSRK